MKHKACPKCPSSDAYWEYEDGHGYCFSCNTYFPASTRTKLSLQAHNSHPLTHGHTTVIVPPYTKIIPKEPLAWLLKYITPDEIRKNDIFWCPEKQGLLFVLDWDAHGTGDANPTIGTYRVFAKNSPKYYTFGKKQNSQKIWHVSKDQLVLCEDILSAIKISRKISSKPLLGTSLAIEKILPLAKKYDRIDVWLDPDKRKEALILSMRLNQFGIKSYPIYSKNDPKTDILNE